MSTFPSRWSITIAGVCLAAVVGVPLSGRRAQLPRPNVPEFHDWTTKHVVYRRVGPMAAMQAASRDPRAMIAWRASERRFTQTQAELQFRDEPFRYRPLPRPNRPSLHNDWSINLGTNGTAPAMYPAKFSFDTTALPSCPNDYVIFPVNAPGTSTQPNIVALNFLYSGTAGATGVCDRKATASDTGVAAEVMWSYNVQGTAIPGSVATSPVISFDPVTPANSGTKVAFVETIAGGQIEAQSLSAGGTNYAVGNTGTVNGGTSLATYSVTSVSSRATGHAVTGYTITFIGTGYAVGNGIATTATSGTGTGFTVNITSVSAASARFHVLAWGSGGSAGQDSSNLQNALTPVTINTFVATTPTAGSGTATDLAFSSSTDTLSSPFVDYVDDLAYVGDDSGVLYRIKNVFCTSVNLKCASNPVPSLDASFGTGGSVTVCSGKLTGPVYDFVSASIFVGCSDGKLYRVTQAGAVSSIVVGNGLVTGGVVDPPIVDGANAFVYAVSGTNGTNAVVLQAKTDFSATRTALLPGTGFHDLHAPAFNDNYYSSTTTSTWILYEGGFDATDANLTLYGMTFDSGGNLTAGAPAKSLNIGTRVAEFSPLSEFLNGTTDWLFLSVLVTPPDIGQLQVATFPTALNATASSGSGTSGIVFDNNSTSAQASSFYFNSQGQNATCASPTTGTNTNGCAVKLTQSGLQ